MIAYSTLWSLVHRKFKNDLASIDKIDKAVDVWPFAVHNVEIVILHHAGDTTSISFYKNCACMLFGKALGEHVTCPMPEVTLLPPQREVPRCRFYVDMQPQIIGSRRYLGEACADAIRSHLADQLQARAGRELFSPNRCLLKEGTRLTGCDASAPQGREFDVAGGFGAKTQPVACCVLPNAFSRLFSALRSLRAALRSLRSWFHR